MAAGTVDARFGFVDGDKRGCAWECKRILVDVSKLCGANRLEYFCWY